MKIESVKGAVGVATRGIFEAREFYLMAENMDDLRHVWDKIFKGKDPLPLDPEKCDKCFMTRHKYLFNEPKPPSA